MLYAQVIIKPAAFTIRQIIAHLWFRIVLFFIIDLSCRSTRCWNVLMEFVNRIKPQTFTITMDMEGVEILE